MADERGRSDVKVWLFVVGGVAIAIGVVVVAYVAVSRPRMVIEGASVGRTVQLGPRYATVFDAASEEIRSTAFFERVRAACADDRELVGTWKMESVQLLLSRHSEGVDLYYDFPAYSTRYFKVFELTEYHGGDDYPELTADVERRNARVGKAIVDCVTARLEELLEAGTGKGGQE
ncbi:MAG: hypothetical protein ACYTKD_11400 [Planctomycetota bacterium]|jgi:hypothetical protein